MPSGAPKSLEATAFALALSNTRRRAELRKQVGRWQTQRDELASFIPVVYKTDEGLPALPPPHLRPVVEAITADSLGDTLIIAPPGSIKTNTLIAACNWWIGRDSTQHIGFFSNTDRQAYRRSVAVRDVIARNASYAAIFPEIVPDFRKGWAEFEWFVERPDAADKDATLMAAGVGSAIQGSRLERLLFDDIADKRNMATALQREKVRDWLVEQAMTRRGPRSRAIMICTRWHAEDPAAWAIAQGWHVIRIAAVNYDDDPDGVSYWPERWPIWKLACPGDAHEQAVDVSRTLAPNPVAWTASDEQPSSPCWVERDADGTILAQGVCWKKRLGARSFNLTYQGVTADDESAIFKRVNWRYYERTELPHGLPEGVSLANASAFLDLAHEEKTENDYTALAIWTWHAPRFYVLDVYRVKLRFPDLLALLRLLFGMTPGEGMAPPTFGKYYGWPIVIEEVSNSLPLIQSLEQELSGIVRFKIGGNSKIARAHASVPYQESGNCYLPADAPWVPDFVEEHAIFPAGEHDDMLDTTTMALLHYTKGGQLATF